MAQTTPRTYLYGIIIMMFFIIGGVAILVEFKAANSNLDSGDQTGEFNRTVNKIDDVNEKIGNLKSNIENADTNFGAFGVLNSLISSAWLSLRLLFDSFSFMDGVFKGLVSIFGVPAWIPILISLIITVTIIFSIYKMIFQTE